MARVIFSRGRGRVSVWLDEPELAEMLAAAFAAGVQHGRARALEVREYLASRMEAARQHEERHT